MMAMPLNGSGTFLVWNKKAYREAGLDPDHAPARLGRRLPERLKLRSGKQFGLNMPAGKSIQTACEWITLFHGFGGGYRDEKGMPAFNSAAGVARDEDDGRAAAKISPPGNLTWDFPEMVNAFAVGQAAQGFMWPGGFSTLLDPSEVRRSRNDLGWAPTPRRVLLGGWAVSVNAKSRSLDAAKLYVGLADRPKRSRRGSRCITGQPARISAFKDPSRGAKYPLSAGRARGHGGHGRRIHADPAIRAGLTSSSTTRSTPPAPARKTPEKRRADAMQEKVTAFMKRRGYLPG